MSTLAKTTGSAIAKTTADAKKLDADIAEYRGRYDSAEGDLERAVILAEGLQTFQAAVRVFLPQLQQLQNSPLGFRTDKADTGYNDAVLVQCGTEALLRGLKWVGNQWNIIAGRCYVTREGYWHLVGGLEGMTDLKMNPGVPIMKDGGAIVDYVAHWKYRDVPDSLTAKIPVRVNSSQGVDAVLGKAERKMLARIYKQVTGTETSEGDVDDAPMPTRTEMLHQKLTEGARQTETAPKGPNGHVAGVGDPAND